MDVVLNTWKLNKLKEEDDFDARMVFAVMQDVFIKYLDQVSAEEYQKHYGTRGVQALAKFTK
jgi:hypothetical protein